MPNLYHTLIRPLNPYLCAVRRVNVGYMGIVEIMAY